MIRNFFLFLTLALWPGHWAVAATPAALGSLADQADAPAISEQTARLQIARLLGQDARVQEAVAEYRKLLAEEPDLYEARLELAGLLSTMGETEEARAMLEAIPKEKLDRGGWETLASIHESQSQFAEAQKIYEDLLSRDPGNQRLRFRLALVLSWQKKYDESLKYLRELARERPEDLQLWRHYAQILGWAGHHGEAIEAWRRTLPPAS